MAADAPAKLYVPTEQGVHDASVVCPVALPYLPVLQAVHDASADPPVSTRYLPAQQAVHDASADPPVTTPYLPAPQAVQAVATVVAPEYCPVQQRDGSVHRLGFLEVQHRKNPVCVLTPCLHAPSLLRLTLRCA